MLLAEPEMRSLRDELQRLCRRLDAVGQVDPPPHLKDSIIQQLPSLPVATVHRKTSFSHWRLAALFAGVLTAATIVYETVQGPAPGSRETAGTMAADVPTTVDSVKMDGGPVTGRATLYRDKTGLAVALEIAAVEPVDVLISTASRSFRINGLGGPAPAGIQRQTVALPGVGMQGQAIELSFLIGDRTVDQATLRAPSGP
jgi:hypothetical protein